MNDKIKYLVSKFGSSPFTATNTQNHRFKNRYKRKTPKTIIFCANFPVGSAAKTITFCANTLVGSAPNTLFIKKLKSTKPHLLAQKKKKQKNIIVKQ